MRNDETAQDHLPGPAPDGEQPDELLRRCADTGDAPAWERFIRCFHPLVVATVVRTIRRYTVNYIELRDDLAQDVYIKLSANRARVLRDFEPRHPGAVFGYLSVIAANVVHDHFKSKTGRRPALVPIPNDLSLPDETEWRILLREINDFLEKSASARDRQIFAFYYRQGMTAKQIASIRSLELTIKGVEAVIVRLNKLIRGHFGGDERQ